MINILDKVTKAYENMIVRVLHIVTISYGLNIPTQKYTGDPIYHISGVLAGVIARGIDHISTIPIIKLMNTPEFEEYGLHDIVRETNPFLGSHPTMKQYILRNIPQDLAVIVISGFFPPIGYAYLTTMPIIYRGHKKGTIELERIISDYKNQKPLQN